MVTTLQQDREQREANEFIEILKTMTEVEKSQIKGIMIGIRLSKAAKSDLNELQKTS